MKKLKARARSIIDEYRSGPLHIAPVPAELLELIRDMAEAIDRLEESQRAHGAIVLRSSLRHD